MESITFGELIKKLRIEKGLALREVAAMIEFDQSLLSKVERNKLEAPERIVLPLSKCLETDYKSLQTKYLSEKIYKELKDCDFSISALELALQRLEKEQKGTSFELKRQKLLKKIKAYLKSKPIEKAWIFGSFARNEESYDSDIDLLIEFIQPNKIDLFDYIGIRQDLQDLTGRQIDLVEQGQEVSKIKPFIHEEKQLIYERKAV